MKAQFLLMTFLLLSSNLKAEEDVALRFQKMAKLRQEALETSIQSTSRGIQGNLSLEEGQFAKYSAERKKYESSRNKLQQQKFELEMKMNEEERLLKTQRAHLDMTAKNFAAQAKADTSSGIFSNTPYDLRKKELEESRKRYQSIAEDLAKHKKESEELARAVDQEKLNLGQAEINGHKAHQALMDLRAKSEGEKKRSAEARGASESMIAAGEAKTLYEQMKEDHYDAKFLLTDFETLKNKFDIQGEKLKALKKENETALKNTLIGDYIDKKLKAEREGAGFCSAIKACRATTVEGGSAVSDATAPEVPSSPAASSPSASPATELQK